LLLAQFSHLLDASPKKEENERGEGEKVGERAGERGKGPRT